MLNLLLDTSQRLPLGLSECSLLRELRLSNNHIKSLVVGKRSRKSKGDTLELPVASLSVLDLGNNLLNLKDEEDARVLASQLSGMLRYMLSGALFDYATQLLTVAFLIPTQQFPLWKTYL